MSRISPFGNKTKLLAFVVFMLSIQSMFGQNALTSVKINIQDIKISKDLKTISYDVYLQDVDATYKVAVSGYGIQLAVPTADLDPLKAKTVSTSNPCPLIGVRLPTMIINGSNWVMKIQGNLPPSSYDGALLVSETFPGTRLATFNITNTDGSAFANPQKFTATFAGITPSTKTTVSVFLQDVVALAPNSTTEQPATNFTGLGVFSLIPPPTSLTISGVTASNKVYDGTTTATLTGGTLVGVVGGDVVTLVAGTGSFSNKTVGSSKVITSTGYSLGGADASKYVLSAQPSGLTANITAASLSTTGVTASNKAYDRTTTATLSAGSLVGVASGDVVTLVAGAGAFSDKNVGTTKVVTATGYSIGGADAANYTLSAQPSGLSANITAASLSTTGVSATSKSYDGTAVASLTGGSLIGVVSGDVVNLTVGNGAFSDKNVGNSKVVTATGYSIGGTDAVNYTLSAQPSGLTANINTISLTISAPNVTLLKLYDASTTAVVTAGALAGVLVAEVANVGVNATATYDNATVATGKTITVSYNLSGSAASNYTAPSNTILTTGEIKPAFLQLTLKVYLEGLWNGALMNKTQEYDVANDMIIDKFSGTIADTLTVELHDMTTYATVPFSVNGLELHQNGSITSPGLGYINVPGQYFGNYRITIKHRNHLETASSSAVSFSTPTPSYDFTDAYTKAFESDGITFTPTKQINGKWMLYVGNIIADSYPEINSLDLYEIFFRNSLATSVYGYMVADINGDGFVDDADFYSTASNDLIYFYLP